MKVENTFSKMEKGNLERDRINATESGTRKGSVCECSQSQHGHRKRHATWNEKLGQLGEWVGKQRHECKLNFRKK